MSEPSNFPILCLEGDAIPDNLRTIEFPPKRLFIQGQPSSLELLKRLPERGLAIVGTRTPQLRSLSLMESWIPPLSTFDLVILSGLARGVDSRAHELALENGLPTIAVVGCSLERVYPAENESLRDRILEAGGLIVSEYPTGTAPAADHFIMRNRLLAGWSKATWVVEAGVRSGALNTARWARDNGRQTYASPAFPGDPAFAGNIGLLTRQAATTLWGPHDFGETWFELTGCIIGHRKKDSLECLKGTDELRMLRRTRTLTREKGGATVQELLDWALCQNWTPRRYFLALQRSVRLGLVRDNQGILTA